MLISSDIVPLKQLIPTVEEHIQLTFVQTDQRQPYLAKIITDGLRAYLESMKPNLWVVIESPYVDKVYRDSYYQYYAGKLDSYSKDCIRLSFFDAPIRLSDFLNPTAENRQKLQRHYLGFLIIRPTPQNPIGRNVLAPRTFRGQPVEVCQTLVPATVNGIKLWATGFPHSGQDVETLTCSQTTLWAVMEYFSHRYPNYPPILPSTIVQQLEGLLVERNLPAPGLSVEQVSFVLKQNGFAPRIYLREDYDEQPDENATQTSSISPRKDFDHLLSCYVESGIPVIVAVRDGDDNGHAMVCIGHETQKSSTVQKLRLDKNAGFEHLGPENRSIKFFDLDQAPRRFVFIDDNYPPYQAANLATPTRYYAKPEVPRLTRPDFDGQTGQVTAFVVPLYRKVYLDALGAKRYVRSLLASGLLDLAHGQEVCLRLFLTSSRSYKDNLLSDALLPEIVKRIVVSVSLPKLIWVAELTNPALHSQNKVFGVAILDSTEADTDDQNALICAVMPQKLINFAAPIKEEQFIPFEEELGPFNQYINNLNPSPRFYVEPLL